MNRVLSVILTGIVILSAWTVIPKSASAAQETPATSSAQPAVTVETITASLSSFTESIDVVGTLTAKHRAEVKSEYAGIVGEIFVNDWVEVKKGDKLARLDSREPQAVLNRAGAAVEMAKADLLQAKAAFTRSERELARLDNLKTSGLATRQNLDEATTEREVAAGKSAAAAAQLRSAEYELELARTRFAKTLITAPISGVIAERGVNVGDLVGEAGSNTALFKIVDNRRLDLKVTVPARYIGNLKTGLPLSFTTASFPERSFEGRVTYLNPSLNDTDRSLQVVVEVPNDPVVLRDGMFVEGRIILQERQGILQIPRGSLISWDMAAGKGEIFVVTDGKAQRRPVETGATRQDRVEIVKGLSAGERVVSGGGFNVIDGGPVHARETEWK